MAKRFSGPGQPYEGLVTAKGRWNGTVRFVPERFGDPLRWKRARRIFVNSMSDLFHDGLTNEQIAAVFGVMAAAHQHAYQVLTKRPARAREWFRWAASYCDIYGLFPGASANHRIRKMVHNQARIAGADLPWNGANDGPWPLPNVWLGVSTEDQATADERIPLLLQCPAAVRWVSAEPLLGPVDLSRVIDEIDWVVAGGESGPGARPMHPDWPRSLRDQCVAGNVPFFFKQWGNWSDVGDAHEMAEHGIAHADNERCVNLNGGHGHGSSPRRMRRVGSASGRILDGRTWDKFPNELTNG